MCDRRTNKQTGKGGGTVVFLYMTRTARRGAQREQAKCAGCWLFEKSRFALLWARALHALVQLTQPTWAIDPGLARVVGVSVADLGVNL